MSWSPWSRRVAHDWATELIDWWWGYATPVLVVRSEAAPVLESTASMVWLLANSNRIYVNTHLPGLLLPVSLSLKHAAADPLLFQRCSNILRNADSVSCGVTVSSPGSWCPQDFVCALQQSLFHPVLWKSCNQILLAFTVRFLGNS